MSVMSTDGLKCSLCSRTFARDQLRYSPVGGGFRHQGSDYLCKPCWQVLCGQPWPEEQSVLGGHSGSPGQQQAHAPRPAQQNGFPGLPPTARPVTQQQQQQQHLHPGSLPLPTPLGTSAPHAAAGTAAYLRRCHSLADFQLAQQQQQLQQHHSGIAFPHQRSMETWQPASMPEVPAILGSAEGDPRWGALAAAASAPAHGRGALRGHHGAGGGGGASVRSMQFASGSAPVFSPFELKNMMDESSLEIFESQSHLLDPETRLQLQKQRQYLEWQQNSMEESGPMRESLERTDSAGSGSGAPDLAALRHEVRTLRAERDIAAQRIDEMCKQLQDKKRQLFTAIQEREQYRERARAAEGKLKQYQEAAHCKLCRLALRNCVVLPCLHFLYCDACLKRHCTSSATCPACSSPVTGHVQVRAE